MPSMPRPGEPARCAFATAGTMPCLTFKPWRDYPLAVRRRVSGASSRCGAPVLKRRCLGQWMSSLGSARATGRGTGNSRAEQKRHGQEAWCASAALRLFHEFPDGHPHPRPRGCGGLADRGIDAVDSSPVFRFGFLPGRPWRCLTVMKSASRCHSGDGSLATGVSPWEWRARSR